MSLTCPIDLDTSIGRLNAMRGTSTSRRTYVHSATDMAQIIREAGFDLVRRRVTWVWSVDVYARVTSQPK